MLRPLLLSLVLLVAGCTTFVGCNAESKSTYRSVTSIALAKNGDLTVTRETGSGSSASAPGPTSQPTVVDANEFGASGSASGEQSTPLSVYGLAQRQWIFYGGAAALLIGAAFAFWFGQRMLAACLSVAAVCLLIAPTFISVAAVPLSIAVLAFIAIAAYYAVKSYFNRRENIAAFSNAKDYEAAGNPEAAKAAMNEAPIVRHVNKARAAREAKAAS